MQSLSHLPAAALTSHVSADQFQVLTVEGMYVLTFN